MNIITITPSGFCMGVERAINMLEDIVTTYKDKSIYCVHEIVHNETVVNYFKKKGVIFIKDYKKIKNKSSSILTFSAHGVNKFVLNKVIKNFYKVINLECPLVTLVYNQAKKFIEKGYTIFYIGKKGHKEAEQIMEYIKDLGGKGYIFLKEEEIPNIDKQTKIAVLNQTTLNYNYVISIYKKIKTMYPNTLIIEKTDICKATFDRQTALKENLDKISALIVIGGKNSSNTKELVKIGENAGKKVFFIQSYKEVENIKNELKKFDSIGITAGASTPKDEIYKAANILYL